MMPSLHTTRGTISRVRNVVANWGSYLFTAIVSFLLAPIIVHGLGDVAYGIWVLLGSLVAYLGLLDLGVRGAVTRFISRFHDQENHLESTRVTSSALTIFILLGLLATSLSALLSVFIPNLFDIPEDLISDARIVLIVGGVNIGVSMVSGVYGGIIIGVQRFDISNTLEIVVGALRAIAIVIAIKSGIGLVALAVIQLVTSCLRGVASYVISRRLYPEARSIPAECRSSHVRMILTFSVSVVLLQASGMLILFTDSVVIGTFLPLAMVTFFAIASNLTEYARALVSGITHTVMPWASTLDARDETDELRRVLITAARISTLVIYPIVLTFILRGEAFIGLWMGPEYSEASGEVLALLALALLFATGYQVIVSTMVGISKHGGLVPAFVIEALFNVGLSVYWVQSYGIIGVAWGTLVPRVLASCFFAPWYARRALGTPIASFWWQVWIRPTAAMLPFAAGSLVIEHWWTANNLFIYFAQVALVLPLAAIGAWHLSLTADERAKLASVRLPGRSISNT